MLSDSSSTLLYLGGESSCDDHQSLRVDVLGEEAVLAGTTGEWPADDCAGRT
jgi:hypothetical protein